MAKKEYNNYDDTLFGRYIRQIENPDSIGWDAVTRTWRQSTRKGDDKRNRGMGIDILNNNAAGKLTQNRSGQYLTEEEENRLRNEYLQEMLNVIERQKKNHPGLNNMSPRKQAEVIGALYRGDAPKLWDKNTTLGKALESKNEEDFHKAIDTYYNSIGLKERAKNNDKFWNSNKSQEEHIPAQTITRQSDGMLLPTVPQEGTWSKISSIPVGETINGVIGKAAQGIDAALSYGQELLKKAPSGSRTNYWAEGGVLKPRDEWDKLSMREKAEMIKVAVKNGITTLPEIRAKYNEFAEGGSMDNPEGWTMEDEARFQEWRNSLPENLRNTDDSDYDMRRAFLSGMQPELQPDGYYHLGSRDPQTGRILKAPHHPTYLEAINSDARIGYYPVTDNKGVTYTDTWKGNAYGGGSYLDIAKQHIRRNEGFVSKPMKDAPKGKNWRSVGYGFNDSGFFGKYKEGISKHYENGISKADAEKELDWILRHDIVPTLQRQYGAKWNEMNDNQKAAIIDTYYQRPASVKKGSKFHSAVMSGNPNAGNYLGVTGYSNRNKDRRKLFGSQYVEAIRDVELPTFTPVDFSDYARYAPYPELLENPLGYQTPSREEFSVLPQQPIVPEYSPEEIERQERRDNLAKLNMFLSMIQTPSDSRDNSMLNALNLLTGGTEYSKGGGIHIKPSHRGRLTELKKRTGKTEAELYRTGSPATRKMITFARNARKWRHGLGGNLFSGEEEGSQKMDRANIFRRPNGEYFYQASPESEEVTVTPLNTLFDNPALWTYTDANGKIYSPRQTAAHSQGTIVRKEDEGPLVEAAKNYLGELQYSINNDIPIGGKYTMPAIAASALLPITGGTSIAGIPATTWADAALTAGFGTHGLNHAINEGIDGWGDAAMTALEVAPLGRLARPMFNEAALAIENYRYPLGKPQIPKDFPTLDSKVILADDKINDTPFFTWGNDSRFKVSPFKKTYKDLYSQLSAAKRYKESPEYANLVNEARKNSEALGFGDFPEDLFVAPNGKSVDIVFESRPKGQLGEYVPEKNAMFLDMTQTEGMEVPYHEGIHWQRVGNPSNIGPRFNKWWEARKFNQPDNIQRQLFDDFRNSEEYNRFVKRRNADNYIEHKVNESLYPFADDYLRAKGELQAHGLEAGRAVGIEPFTPYPGTVKALEAIEKARKYDPYLKDVKSGGEENVERFWKILTGQLTPALIPVGLIGTKYNLNAK